MILATCQCRILSYIPSIGVSHSLLLSSLANASVFFKPYTYKHVRQLHHKGVNVQRSINGFMIYFHSVMS